MSGARLEQARKGDADAFAEVFEALRPSVLALAGRVAGPDDAEDVTMQAFLKAWQALPEFQGRSSLKSWVYRIAYNCALDTVRQRRRLAEVRLAAREGDGGEAGDPIEELPDERAALPAAGLEAAETRQRVRRGLTHLSDEHRLALELRYVDGLSYGEIAAATGVSLGTVMSRLFNAKHKLRRVLEAGERSGGGP